MHFYFGLDVDPVAFELGRSRIHSVLHTPNSGTNTIDRSQLLKVYTHLRNFKHIKSVISTAALEDDGFLLLHKGINGVLMDLGMSSMQVSRIHSVAISQLKPFFYIQKTHCKFAMQFKYNGRSMIPTGDSAFLVMDLWI